MSGKLNKKIISRVFLWGISILFAVTMVYFLIHDVGLNVEIMRLAITDIPELRLENIRFERDISGTHWRINIPSLERQSGIVRILSIYISREFSNGDIWEIRGNDGEYIENAETATFNEISGNVVVDGQVFEIHTPHALWERSGDLVTLSKGIVIRGGFGSISADKAKIEAGNLIIMEGGEIIWNISSYDARI